MKSHFTIEQFLPQNFRGQLGAALALLRVASAWAIASVCLQAHAAMGEVLARLGVQTFPFLEVFATMWNFSWWSVIITIAACAFAVGFLTRISAGVLLLFLVGVFVIDRDVFFLVLGAWAPVGPLVLIVALLSRWGLVFGIDEFLERWTFFRQKGKRGGMMR